MSLAPGTKIAQYVVDARIGRGGMATVYRVRHTGLGTRFALKLLDDTSPELVSRLLDEGRMQAELHHPNVVSVIDVVVHEGAPGLVMEYVDGPSLQVLMAAGRVPAEVVEVLVTGILHGVRAAHNAGFVHRDLKPGNILLARADDRLLPKVSDFGLARVVAAADAAGRRTDAGVVFGTPAYMAPEQIQSTRDADARADVYAIGAILYELVTGRVPVDDPDLVRRFAKITEREYRRPRVLAPALAEHQDEAIWAALEPDPDRRIPDCSTLLAAWRGQIRFRGTRVDAASVHPFDREYLGKVMALANEPDPDDEPIAAPSWLIGRNGEVKRGTSVFVVGIVLILFGLALVAFAVVVGFRDPNPVRLLRPDPVVQPR